jgi:hypothetical protein
MSTTGAGGPVRDTDDEQRTESQQIMWIILIILLQASYKLPIQFL